MISVGMDSEAMASAKAAASLLESRKHQKAVYRKPVRLVFCLNVAKIINL
jgi:hypothetical protein